jgi:riboflavin synthase
MRPGDSLAVDGVCLTATAAEGGHVFADVGPETLRVTTLGSMRPGQLVNLERAMRADARFGGHFVQGHVDGTGLVKVVRNEGESHWVTISLTRRSLCIPGVQLPWMGSA